MSTSIKQNSEGKPSSTQDFLMRLGIISELLSFLWKRKLYWMIPLIMTLLVFGILIMVGSSSPLGFFIYPIL